MKQYLLVNAVPKAFSEWVVVNFQLGDLQDEIIKMFYGVFYAQS